MTRINDLQNRLTKKGDTSYTYDNAGNLISDGKITYTYNAQNKLARGENTDGESSEYTYNALGVRIQNVQVRENANAGYQNSNLIDGSGGEDYLPYLRDGRFEWQRVWESEIGTTVQNNFETVTRNYILDYLSLANRDILVTEDGSFTERYVYDASGIRVSAEYGYADGTHRGEGGENLASDLGRLFQLWQAAADSFAKDSVGKSRISPHTVPESLSVGLPTLVT
ncbi:MAG: hypothetical protein LBN00_04055 [Oscillospiraceae bacterium]|nr:hypothetical protein [Oscillospiraceae bacterium]